MSIFFFLFKDFVLHSALHMLACTKHKFLEGHSVGVFSEMQAF